jgi:hypothetical protein
VESADTVARSQHLVQSAKLNGLDPWAHLREVLWRSHSHPNHQIGELLPHSWQPTDAS